MKELVLLAALLMLPRHALCLPSPERNMEVGLGIKAQLRSLQRLPAEKRIAEQKRLIYALGGVAKVQAKIFLAEAKAARTSLRSILLDDPETVSGFPGTYGGEEYLRREYSELIEAYRSGINAYEECAEKLIRISILYREWGRLEKGKPGVGHKGGKGAVEKLNAHSRAELAAKNARVKTESRAARVKNKSAKKEAVYIKVKPGQSVLGLVAKYRGRYKLTYSRFLVLNPSLKADPDVLWAHTRVRVR